MMLIPQCKALIIGALLLLIAIAPANAADRPFAGRWRGETDAGISPVGIVRVGEVLFLFSAKGWGIAEIKPESAVLLSPGRGQWALGSEDQRTDVAIQGGQVGDILYLVITPSDPNAKQVTLKHRYVLDIPEPLGRKA